MQESQTGRGSEARQAGRLVPGSRWMPLGSNFRERSDKVQTGPQIFTRMPNTRESDWKTNFNINQSGSEKSDRMVKFLNNNPMLSDQESVTI